MLLKVAPGKGVIRFWKRDKLVPRFIRSFRVGAQVCKVAYRLDLPVNLSQIHNTFYFSQLWKCLVYDFVVVSLMKFRLMSVETMWRDRFPI